MGLFGTKVKSLTQPRQLKTGAAIPLTDVDPGFAEWARATKEPVKSLGHVVTVRVELRGEEVIVMAGDGSVVGRMEPKRVPFYRNEFQRMQSAGQYGVAQVGVSKASNKDRCVLLINYDEACRDGGIL